MRQRKILPLSVLAVSTLCLLASCGASKLTHEINHNIGHYQADLNHDGIISENEKNLTWQQSYDKLLAQTNSYKELEQFADTMNISTDAVTKDYRTLLARYEILHQVEELVMQTGAIMPLYNYEDSFMIKEGIHGQNNLNKYGMYSSSLGYKFFERMEMSGRSSFRVCVGSKAQTMDPTKNTTVEAATMISQCLVGVNRWVPAGTTDKPFAAALGEGIATTSKTVDMSGHAHWTIKINANAKWQDGTDVTSKDFIWAWNRSADANSGSQFSSMFDCIKGYSDWHTKEDLKPYDYYNGMTGLKYGDDNKTFTVELINDCAYFDELLAFPSFMPLPRHHMTTNTGYENEEIDDSWWKNVGNGADGIYFCGNGPLKFTTIDNKEGGSVVCSRNDNYLYNGETKVDSITFALIDDDSAMLTQYKDGSLQFIDTVAAGSVDDMKAKYPKEFKFADQTALYYFLFNVNDNTFDMPVNMNLSQSDQEGKREKLRWVMDLLINRNDICTNVGRSGQTPSSGFVSDGVVENVLPVWAEERDGVWYVPGTNTKTKAPGKDEGVAPCWCLSVESDGKTPKTLDWQKRNRPFSGFTEFKTWGAGKNTNEYNVFADRTEPTIAEDGQLQQGFFPTFSGKTTTGEEIDPKGTIYANSVKAAQTLYIETAVKLAKEAGITVTGNSPENYRFVDFPQVKLTMNTGTGHEQVAEKLQFYYGLFGIKFQVETQEWNSFNSSKRKGNFALARNGWTADYRDPRTYLDICLTENGNNDCQFGKDAEKQGAYIHISK